MGFGFIRLTNNGHFSYFLIMLSNVHGCCPRRIDLDLRVGGPFQSFPNSVKSAFCTHRNRRGSKGGLSANGSTRHAVDRGGGDGQFRRAREEALPADQDRGRAHRLRMLLLLPTGADSIASQHPVSAARCPCSTILGLHVPLEFDGRVGWGNSDSSGSETVY